MTSCGSAVVASVCASKVLYSQGFECSSFVYTGFVRPFLYIQCFVQIKTFQWCGGVFFAYFIAFPLFAFSQTLILSIVYRHVSLDHPLVCDYLDLLKHVIATIDKNDLSDEIQVSPEKVKRSNRSSK